MPDIFTKKRWLCSAAHLRTQSQCSVQAAAILTHPHGEVSVPSVHRRHPPLEFSHMDMPFLNQTTSQLDQQLHLLLCLLESTSGHIYSLYKLRKMHLFNYCLFFGRVARIFFTKNSPCVFHKCIKV